MAGIVSPSPSHQQAQGLPDVEFPAKLRGKRILLATESLGQINGVSRTTQSLIQHLRANGVHVAVVAPMIKGYVRKPLVVGNDPEIRVHGSPLPYSPDLMIAYPLRLDRLYERTFKPDLIYLASPASVGFQILLQIRQFYSPVPVLLNFQTDLSQYGEILLPPPMDRFAVWLLKVVQGFLFNHKAIKTIFYPSDMVRRYLEHAGAPPEKMIHLGRGVDTALFSPSRRDEQYRQEIAPNGEIVLLCVGRMAAEKGHGFLSEVCQMLVTRNLHFKMVIVGGNKNPVVDQEVRDLFLPIKDHVIFTGFKQGEELAQVYASADIFCHCSVTETFGLVVLEAMASGVPVVARDAGGPSEIVADGKSGYLVPPEDTDGFVDCVERLARNAQLRTDQANVARDMALSTTWRKINNKVAIKLAEALPLVEKRTPIKNWVFSHLFTVTTSTIVILRLNAAIGLICFIWLIACVPLLVHGNSKALGPWQQFYSLPTWNYLGNTVSGWSKIKVR